MRDALATESDQLSGKRIAGIAGLAQLDDRLHFFTELLVRYADYCDISHLRVAHQHMLGLLRINIHTARDNHERLAIRQIDIAFLVEVADIADADPSLGISDARGLFRIISGGVNIYPQETEHVLMSHPKV